MSRRFAGRVAQTLSARTRATAASNRAGGDEGLGALFHPKVLAMRWEKQQCIFCGKSPGLRVGRLPLSGNVYFCKNHQNEYHDAKNLEMVEKRKGE